MQFLFTVLVYEHKDLYITCRTFLFVYNTQLVYVYSIHDHSRNYIQSMFRMFLLSFHQSHRCFPLFEIWLLKVTRHLRTRWLQILQLLWGFLEILTDHFWNPSAATTQGSMMLNLLNMLLVLSSGKDVWCCCCVKLIILIWPPPIWVVHVWFDVICWYTDVEQAYTQLMRPCNKANHSQTSQGFRVWTASVQSPPAWGPCSANAGAWIDVQPFTLWVSGILVDLQIHVRRNGD